MISTSREKGDDEKPSDHIHVPCRRAYIHKFEGQNCELPVPIFNIPCNFVYQTELITLSRNTVRIISKPDYTVGFVRIIYLWRTSPSFTLSLSLSPQLDVCLLVCSVLSHSLNLRKSTHCSIRERWLSYAPVQGSKYLSYAYSSLNRASKS